VKPTSEPLAEGFTEAAGLPPGRVGPGLALPGFLAGGAKAAGIAARSPLIRVFGGERPQEFRACQVLVVADVLALVGSAVVLVRLPAAPRGAAPGYGSRWTG